MTRRESIYLWREEICRLATRYTEDEISQSGCVVIPAVVFHGLDDFTVTHLPPPQTAYNITNISYLHELQNLIKSITGEELTIKL